MKRLTLMGCGLVACLLSDPLVADGRAAEQAQLDRACEAAREARLAPLREAAIRDCMRKPGKDRAACERLHGHYGERSGSRPALFYDLPECERAFEYQRSYRRSE